MDDLGEFPALLNGLRAASLAAGFGRDPCRLPGLPEVPRPSRWPLGPAAPGHGTARLGFAPPARSRPVRGVRPAELGGAESRAWKRWERAGRGRSAAAIRLQQRAAGCR